MVKATRKVKSKFQNISSPKQKIPVKTVWKSYPQFKPRVGSNYFILCEKANGERIVVDTGHMSENEFRPDKRYGKVIAFCTYKQGSNILIASYK